MDLKKISSFDSSFFCLCSSVLVHFQRIASISIWKKNTWLTAVSSDIVSFDVLDVNYNKLNSPILNYVCSLGFFSLLAAQHLFLLISVFPPKFLCFTKTLAKSLLFLLEIIFSLFHWFVNSLFSSFSTTTLLYICVNSS